MTDPYDVPLPTALARLALTLAKWAGLLVGCFVLASLLVATMALLLAVTLTLYIFSIIVIVVVLL